MLESAEYGFCVDIVYFHTEYLFQFLKLELVTVRLEKSFLYQSKTGLLGLSVVLTMFIWILSFCVPVERSPYSIPKCYEKGEMEQCFKLLKQMKSSKAAAAIQW